ncbi:hypothetical protein M3Y98_01186100 [Aphelenchoides besseyi]|nr:hypothetical protein M3Y98_01186100 [Aphelenchoides besseyi]
MMNFEDSDFNYGTPSLPTPTNDSHSPSTTGTVISSSSPEIELSLHSGSRVETEHLPYRPVERLMPTVIDNCIIDFEYTKEVCTQILVIDNQSDRIFKAKWTGMSSARIAGCEMLALDKAVVLYHRALRVKRNTIALYMGVLNIDYSKQTVTVHDERHVGEVPLNMSAYLMRTDNKLTIMFNSEHDYIWTARHYCITKQKHDYLIEPQTSRSIPYRTDNTALNMALNSESRLKEAQLMKKYSASFQRAEWNTPLVLPHMGFDNFMMFATMERPPTYNPMVRIECHWHLSLPTKPKVFQLIGHYVASTWHLARFFCLTVAVDGTLYMNVIHPKHGRIARFNLSQWDIHIPNSHVLRFCRLIFTDQMQMILYDGSTVHRIYMNQVLEERMFISVPVDSETDSDDATEKGNSESDGVMEMDDGSNTEICVDSDPEEDNRDLKDLRYWKEYMYKFTPFY